MEILFIIDPLEELKPETDTTLAIMKEALRRQHTVWITTVQNLFIQGNKPWAHLTLWKKKSAVLRSRTLAQPLEKFPVIFMRKDPPITVDYILSTSLLSLIPPKKSTVINHPAALRNFNEKLGIFQFKEFIPETIVAKQYKDILPFLNKHRKIVLKPLEGFGGSEVIMLDKNDKNQNALLEMLTRHETRYVMAQKYLAAVKQGDKRVLLLDGKVLGQQNRIAAKNDHRSNISAGGTSYKTRLTNREKRICAIVGKALREQGIYFAGIDLIGGYITEINVTSPTGLVKMNGHEKAHLEEKVVDWMEKIAKS